MFLCLLKKIEIVGLYGFGELRVDAPERRICDPLFFTSRDETRCLPATLKDFQMGRNAWKPSRKAPVTRKYPEKRFLELVLTYDRKVMEKVKEVALKDCRTEQDRADVLDIIASTEKQAIGLARNMFKKIGANEYIAICVSHIADDHSDSYHVHLMLVGFVPVGDIWQEIDLSIVGGSALSNVQQK